MKVSAIKKLAENLELNQLRQLEVEITEEKPLTFQVEGEDEGEQLTHVLAAIWIKEQMIQNGSELKTELRNYTQRVRGSIS